MTGNNTNPNSSTTLRRSADQKIFAGVCGGLGEHFDINAWWFRWAFIILAFFGFAGFALYILAWLLIPRSDGTESVAGGWFEDLDMSDAGTLFGVILIGVAALIVATSVFHISGAIVIAVALGLVGFLLYRGDIRPPVNVTITKDDDDPSSGGPSPSQTNPPEPSDEATDTVPAESTAAGTVAFAAAGSVATKPPKARKPPKVKKPKAPRSMLGRLTMAVMLIALSSMAILELAEIVHFQAYEYAALAMGIVGLGLLIGAWIGRAYWLIFIGLLIGPIVLVSSFLPKIDNWSAGDPYHEPQTVSDVRDEYSLTFGDLDIDLTALTEQQLAEVGKIEASIGAGQIDVRVPLGVGVVVHAEIGAGSIQSFVNYEQIYEVPTIEVERQIEECVDTGGDYEECRELRFLTDDYWQGEFPWNAAFYDSGIGLDRDFQVGTAPFVLELDLSAGAGEIMVQQNGQQVTYEQIEG